MEFHERRKYDYFFYRSRQYYSNDTGKEKIQRIILEHTAKDETVLFYLGGYGNFDHLSYRFAICNRNQSMPYPFEPMFVMILSFIH